MLSYVGLSLSLCTVRASPTLNDLNGIDMLSSTDGWAVGNGGITLHYDGSSWSQIPSGTSADLFGVSFGTPSAPNPHAGFAVGGSAGISAAIFRNDVTWSGVNAGLSSPDAQRLSSVFQLSPNDAWAVDAVSDVFWHWSGSAGLGGGWTLVSRAVGGLNSVWMTSVTDGWAVGVGGIIYRYTGGSWSLYSTVGSTLNSVFMLNPNEGWAVGDGGVIYHFTSGVWGGPLSPGLTSQDLKSIFMVNPSEGWAVGNSGTVLHYSAGLWTTLGPNQVATNQDLNAVYFAVGTGWVVGKAGTILVLSSQVAQGIPAANLQSVFLSSTSDGWIVACATGGCGSGSGEPVVVHWDGNSFTRGVVSGPAADLYSVFMVSSSEGWAVGGVGSSPLVLHYTGGTWTQVPTPSGFVLRSVFMVDSSNGWAVGSAGTILRYSSGSWASVFSPTTMTLRSVYMLGASDGWAVGDGGELLRYQAAGGQWTKFPSPTGAQLNSVSLSDLSHGWAVGAGGTILHYDGTLWVSVANFASANLNSVFQVNPQEAWAVGDSATILQWTGMSWYPVTPSPALSGNPNLNSIFMTSPSFGLIVGGSPGPGSQGTLLQIPQMINPIPEFSALQIVLAAIFIVGLTITSRIREGSLPHSK